MAVREISLGVGGSAPPGDRMQADGRRRGASTGARLSRGLGRYVQLSGARLLPQAWFRGFRRARLVAGAQTHLLAQAARVVDAIADRVGRAPMGRPGGRPSFDGLWSAATMAAVRGRAIEHGLPK